MFCTNCGKRIIDTARFCNYCGAKIVGIDENRGLVSDNITEKPVPLTSENVINTGNVENSGNLLKMTGSVPSSIPKMNEPPKSGYSPDSVPITPDSEMSAVPTVLPEAGAAPGSALSATSTASVLPEAGAAPDSALSATSTASVLPEAGAAPDSALSATPAASVLPEAGAAPGSALSATPAASVLHEAGTAPDAYAVPTGLPEMGAPVAAPDANPAPRKYTLGHLIMCLAASGVMAIAAGIFAGLYFSVV